MENDRYNRDTRRNDYGTENDRYGSDRRNPRGDWRGQDRDDNRRDYGGNESVFGSNREAYGFRGAATYNSDRDNESRRRGGYDEWARFGPDSSSDRGSSDRGYGGASDWRRGDDNRDRYSSYDRDRSFGGDRSSYDRFAGDRSYGGQSYGGGERGDAQGGRGFWDKASDEVSSWFGDRDAERRREQDQYRGRGPKGYSRSDDRIKDDINDRLTDDGWVDASDIEVAVSNREVTLTGTVSDRNTKRRAEDIAEGVSGVSHVQNNLRVKSGEATGYGMGSGGTMASSSTAAGSTGVGIGGGPTGSASGAGSSSGTDVDVDRTGSTIAKSGAGGQR